VSAFSAMLGPDIEIVNIRFGREWPTHPFAVHAAPFLGEGRVVGVARVVTGGAEREGILIRNTADKHYRLVGPEAFPAIDTRATEQFLARIRSGHHGGGGRCQGRTAVDDVNYPRRHAATLPGPAVETLATLGDGNISLGLRKLHRNIARKLIESHGRIERIGAIAPGYADPISRARNQDLIAVNLYVPPETPAFFRTLGNGNASAGIRAALWLRHHRI